jgi:hypothetical protein
MFADIVGVGGMLETIVIMLNPMFTNSSWAPRDQIWGTKIEFQLTETLCSEYM